jgi:hypothetical protein
MNFPTKVGFALVLTLSIETSSIADMVTYTQSISQTLPYTFTGTTQTTSAAILPQFSTSLGSLNGISITQLNYITIDAQSKVEAGEYINGYNITGWNWAVIAGSSLGVPGGSDPGTYVYYSTYGDYDSPISPETAHVNFSTTFTGNTIFLNSNYFNTYTGNGDVTASLLSGITTAIQPLPATLAGFTWQLLGENIAGGIAMEDTDVISVTYSFTPNVVPEPRSLLLVILAIGLVVSYRYFSNIMFAS